MELNNDEDSRATPRTLLGRRLRRMRKDAALSLRALAEQAGYPHTYLGRVELRDQLPSEALAIALDAYFGTSGLFVDLLELAQDTSIPDYGRAVVSSLPEPPTHGGRGGPPGRRLRLDDVQQIGVRVSEIAAQVVHDTELPPGMPGGSNVLSSQPRCAPSAVPHRLPAPLRRSSHTPLTCRGHAMRVGITGTVACPRASRPTPEVGVGRGLSCRPVVTPRGTPGS
ncbi:helix-turn-helix domain-containing protein [Streptomyces sp. NPDC057539]|uniref:helix-turn-helix domain-containing protein n=1 Tax=Streptomyces sp. NPDC057539 TaxID=3346159 RepID=UPI0036BBF0EF